MPKPRLRVYIETTIPSAYYTGRMDPEMARRHLETRRWWEMALRSCELVTSDAVREELARGTSVHVAPRLRLLEPLMVLQARTPVLDTAAIYIARS